MASEVGKHVYSVQECDDNCHDETSHQDEGLDEKRTSSLNQRISFSFLTIKSLYFVICCIIAMFAAQTFHGAHAAVVITNGAIQFEDDLGVETEYSLTEDMMEGRWILGPYVTIAKEFIMTWVHVDIGNIFVYHYPLLNHILLVNQECNI